MDLGKAFSYVFEDSEWVKKVVVGGIVNLIPIVNFAATGYAIEQLKNVSEGKYTPLPEWDEFGKKFLDGLFIFFALLVWSLPAIILIAGTIPALVIGVLRGNGAGIGAFGIGFMFSMLWLLLVALIYPAIAMNFSKKRSFSSCFEFSNIFSMITMDIGSYILGIIAYIGALILAALIISIPLIGWIVFTFATFYVYLVVAGAFGQILAKENIGNSVSA